MDPKVILEIVGYIGSVLVVVSMLMTSVVKLRLINMIGSVISIVYAAIVHAYPLAIMNFCLVVINVYNLYKLLHTKKEYAVVQVSADDSFVKFFIDEYKTDINNYFADFTSLSGCNNVHMVCCGTTPVGIIAGSETSGTDLNVKLDYTVPMYRDCSVGKFLYSYLASKGIRHLQATADCDSHKLYLSRMGFTYQDETFTKEL